jgi:hypothetical protein
MRKPFKVIWTKETHEQMKNMFKTFDMEDELINMAVEEISKDIERDRIRKLKKKIGKCLE